MKKFILFLILFLNILNSYSQIDTTYVKSEELEYGWIPEYDISPWEPYRLKTYVNNLFVSKDGKWLSYQSGGFNDADSIFGIWIYNISNKTNTKLKPPD